MVNDPRSGSDSELMRIYRLVYTERWLYRWCSHSHWRRHGVGMVMRGPCPSLPAPSLPPPIWTGREIRAASKRLRRRSFLFVKTFGQKISMCPPPILESWLRQCSFHVQFAAAQPQVKTREPVSFSEDVSLACWPRNFCCWQHKISALTTRRADERLSFSIPRLLPPN